ncbi:acyl-CoA synthetase [Paraburkholderia sp. MM5477-R1]|uniref:acyl-CoA synthetase n=1 Tax=Paraburkholderia sp. MM5477-R1 TaxID=2991062 RepID=UPI003D2377F6
MNGVASQQDILAIEAQGLPADLPASTFEMICRGAAIDPSAPALSFFLTASAHRDVERWTYCELVADITRTANFFARLNGSEAPVIAYVLPNLPETHLVIWGGQAAGIVCAINPLLEGEALAELLNAAGATVLVTLAPFPGVDIWQKVSAILPRLDALQHLVLVDMADRAPSKVRLEATLLQRNETSWLYGGGGLGSTIPSHIEAHDFGAAIARESGAQLSCPRGLSGDNLSSYFCTGGTTGLPKIAMRRHRNEVANAWSAGKVFGDSMAPGKTVFCGLPLFHVNAVLATGLLPFSKGAHVVLGTPLGYRGDGVVKRFWEIVEHHRINFFSGVPTLYASLLDVPVGDHDVSSLEYGLCGAAPMPTEVFRAFQERTGIKILEGYGLTEGTCVSSINPPRGERRLGSIGLRVPGQHMKAIIVDDAGRYVRDCETGEPGLLVVSGPNIFCGYVQREQNAGLWVDLEDGKHWLNTGDIGCSDADGYFRLTGRKKDLIIRGGHNIDPAAIEEPLHCHPAVQIAAAVGRPDAHAGELPVAYVQLKPGASATEEELADFARHAIAERAAVPKQVRIVNAMPLTGVGKIFKPELKRRETADALRSALVEAGIEGASLSVDESNARGVSIRVELPEAAQEDIARAVLGRFPFSFCISPFAQSWPGALPASTGGKQDTDRLTSDID